MRTVEQTTEQLVRLFNLFSTLCHKKPNDGYYYKKSNMDVVSFVANGVVFLLRLYISIKLRPFHKLKVPNRTFNFSLQC